MVEHPLKCLTRFYEQILMGLLSHQVRADDRGGFEPGDVLYLQEYDLDTVRYSGRSCKVTVLSVARDIPGLAPGYCIMAVTVPWDRREGF